MMEADSRDSIHTPIGYGVAAAPGAVVPDVVDPTPNVTELKQALRDPAFAQAFSHELRIQTLLSLTASLCLLSVFFFIGFLLTHQPLLGAIAMAFLFAGVLTCLVLFKNRLRQAVE